MRAAERTRGSGFFLRAESLYDVATWVQQAGLSQYAWEDLHGKSHGEALLWLAKERLGEGGLFILDEPEAALAPQRQLAFLMRMKQLVEAGS